MAAAGAGVAAAGAGAGAPAAAAGAPAPAAGAEAAAAGAFSIFYPVMASDSSCHDFSFIYGIWSWSQGLWSLK